MTAYTPESNPQAPLRLLSLDGGGVRGLSSLMVLEDLMQSIAAQEKRLKLRAANDDTPLKPSDYFDLIGGTSTGGIIAVLLGRLRLDVRTCIRIYHELSAEIFAKDRSFTVGGVKLPTSKTRFSGAVLERAVKRALVKLGFREDELMWDGTLFEEVAAPRDQKDSIWSDVPQLLTESPVESRSETNGSNGSPSPTLVMGRGGPDGRHHVRRTTWRMRKCGSVHKKPNEKGCRAFVVSSLKNALGLPRILSTYDPNDRQTKIWEALRATSAAPRFFEEMKFGTPAVTYLDGAVGFNNPCAEVAFAARSIWEDRTIGIIVSVGTGLQTIPSVKSIASWLPFGIGSDIALAAALANMATSTARVDNEMQRTYYGSCTKYFRFDCDGGLANVPLEQWMREDEMAALTEQYMRDSVQVQRSKEFAEIMLRLSAPPPRFEINAQAFRVGIRGRDVLDGAFKIEELDFKTGFPLGVSVSVDDLANLAQYQYESPSGKGGVALDDSGHLHKVYPVAMDLDGDGRREETAVLTCVRAERVCLRALRTNIPSGKYRVKFIVCFFGTEHTPPTEVIFSVGKPYDPEHFTHRFVDVKITPDMVPVLLHPDAVRVRVGRTRYTESKGKGWMEIEGDVEVPVGLDGTLGFVISSIYKEDVFLGGWSFGGVRLEPVFG